MLSWVTSIVRCCIRSQPLAAASHGRSQTAAGGRRPFFCVLFCLWKSREAKFVFFSNQMRDQIEEHFLHLQYFLPLLNFLFYFQCVVGFGINMTKRNRFNWNFEFYGGVCLMECVFSRIFHLSMFQYTATWLVFYSLINIIVFCV